MIRVTIELLPGGNETGKRTIGLVEIANVGGTHDLGNYAVVLKKTPPFTGALRQAWKRGDVTLGREFDDVVTGGVEGHHRQKRGVYDLLYLALRACGLAHRNKTATITAPGPLPHDGVGEVTP
jgi:hypothetical protein